MEMKEIIIDGVDVAGCRNYKHNAENIGWSKCLSKDEEHYHCNNPLCCEKKDCYYKQLKRLEKQYNDLINRVCLENYERLEQENAELKAENERLKEKTIRLSEENGNLIIRANTSYNNYRDTQRRLDELCKANIHNLALLSKANKTLQEIKNFLELPEFYLYGKETIHDRILQKITKAEVGE